MKFKFHWGWGILTFFILFFGSIIVRIVISSGMEVDLISKDYYHKELNYELDIQKQKNAELLVEKITVKVRTDSIVIFYPEIMKNQKCSGDLLFYCPSKTNKDMCFHLNTGSSFTQAFSTNQFTEKRYILKIDWTINETAYYQEFVISLP